MNHVINILILIIIANSVSAVCSVTFDKDAYDPTESIEALMVCTSPSETSKTYTLTWRNSTSIIETDESTTPDTANEYFFETYSIPSTMINTTINATLTGTGLEGYDEANISDNIANRLRIEDCKFQPQAFIGADFTVSCTIYDIDGNTINNADTIVYGRDIGGSPLQVSEISENTHNGVFIASGILKSENLLEDTSYISEIHTICGIGDNACWNSEGETIEKYQGSSAISFRTARWLNVDTFVEQDNYESKQIALICANITSVDSEDNLLLNIFYQVLCRKNDTDVVIAANSYETLDHASIYVNETKNHCWGLVINEERWIQGRVNSCYASTDVIVINDEYEQVKAYHTDSERFNITMEDLGINADWLITGDNNEHFYTKVNMSESKYSDFNPQAIAGNMDVRLNMKEYEYIDAYKNSNKEGMVDFNNFINLEHIKEINATECNGTPIAHRLEISNEGYVEIELPLTDLSTACIEINLVMNTYKNREISALENWGNYLIQWLGWLIPK